MSSSVPRPSFLDYTPVSLAFGTSGLRGLVKDITDLEAYINVKATLRYLLTTGDIRPGSRRRDGEREPHSLRPQRHQAERQQRGDLEVRRGGHLARGRPSARGGIRKDARVLRVRRFRDA